MDAAPSPSPIAGRVPGGLLSALILSVGLAAALVAGAVYTYLRKDITIVVAGKAVRATTFKRTVAQVLIEGGVQMLPTDEVDPGLGARLSEGARVVIRRAVPLTLIVDGQTLEVETAAATVADVLDRRRVVLSPADKVFPSLQAPVARGMRVRVVRIQHKVVAEQIPIPYQVQSSRDPSTPRGIVRVRVPGRVGLRERLFKVTLADGIQVSRVLVGQRAIRSPLDRVITIGTQVLIASRGQFAGKEYLDMVATAYSPFCCRGVDDITALGMRAGYGVVAVDPKVIPLRSRLYIEGYGYAVAGDTGGRIKGLRIDLGFDTVREAIRFGRQPVRVYIIERKEKKPSAQAIP